MRIATYNVEWFTNLFDSTDTLMMDDGPSGRWAVTRGQQAAALGHVFRTLDADAVMVIEAPDEGSRRSTVLALEGFARHFGLRARRTLIGFASETQQEIAFLYDPDALTALHDPLGDATGKRGAPDAPRFDGVWQIDLDLDGTPERVRFSKPPLELLVETARGTCLRLIGVHAKSKAPHGAKTPEEVLRVSIQNRRTQYAQCLWLRTRVEEHLGQGDPLIVLGDLNDGPGLDEYEKLFGHSGVEIVMGVEASPALRLHDPNARRAFSGRVAASPASARFQIGDDGQFLSALLDYILISPDLCGLAPVWRIWHPFDDPACFADADLRAALLLASDHFPVTLDIDL